MDKVAGVEVDFAGMVPPPNDSAMNADGNNASTATLVAGSGGNKGKPLAGNATQQKLKASNFRKHVAFYNMRILFPASQKPVDESITW